MEQREILREHVENLETNGHSVHDPSRDNDLTQPEYEINDCNRAAMENADEIHILFEPTSQGSLIDIGMAFALRKRLRLINHAEIMANVHGTQSLWALLADWYNSEKGGI